jgi:hypothetical protein
MALKPGLALLCGMYLDNKYVLEDEKKREYIKMAAYYVEDLVIEYAVILEISWREKAEAEAKGGKIAQ